MAPREHIPHSGVLHGVWVGFVFVLVLLGVFDEGELSAVPVCFILFYWPVQYF